MRKRGFDIRIRPQVGEFDKQILPPTQWASLRTNIDRCIIRDSNETPPFSFFSSAHLKYQLTSVPGLMGVAVEVILADVAELWASTCSCTGQPS